MALQLLSLASDVAAWSTKLTRSTMDTKATTVFFERHHSITEIC